MYCFSKQTLLAQIFRPRLRLTLTSFSGITKTRSKLTVTIVSSVQHVPNKTVTIWNQKGPFCNKYVAVKNKVVCKMPSRWLFLPALLNQDEILFSRFFHIKLNKNVIWTDKCKDPGLHHFHHQWEDFRSAEIVLFLLDTLAPFLAVYTCLDL